MPKKRGRRQRTSPVTTHIATVTVPPIYRLPNELLLLIFTLVLLPDGNPYHANLVPIPPYSPRGHVNPILVLRWVSTWFRKIASDPTFWVHDDFDIRSMLPVVGGKVLKNSAQYIQTLLDDDSLRRSPRQTKYVLEVLSDGTLPCRFGK